jgi:hypothetical protein
LVREWRIDEKCTWRLRWQGRKWRQQASHVHWVDRHVGSTSSIDGGIELKLVFRGEWKACGEKNQRLAARDGPKGFRQVADGQKER